MRAELAMTSQQGQRDKASLRFLHRVVRMEPHRLTKQVYNCVKCDPHRERGAKENWVTVTMQTILKRYKIKEPTSEMSKGRWNKQCREAVEAHDFEKLACAKANESKLDEYAELHVTAGDMPRYLKQRRTWWMCHGRSVKTKLRCGTSELEIETGRHARPFVPRSQRICKCCARGEVEDSFHFVMRCARFQTQRQQMMNEIERAITGTTDFYRWRKMNVKERWAFLLGDGPPVHDNPRANQQWGRMETALYHFLSCAYKARRAFLKS